MNAENEAKRNEHSTPQKSIQMIRDHHETRSLHLVCQTEAVGQEERLQSSVQGS